MPLNCKFHQEGDVMVCEHGLLRIPILDASFAAEQYHGRCELKRTENLSVMDRWHLALKASYLRLKYRLGLTPTCNCDRRYARTIAYFRDVARFAVAMPMGLP